MNTYIHTYIRTYMHTHTHTHTHTHIYIQGLLGDSNADHPQQNLAGAFQKAREAILLVEGLQTLVSVLFLCVCMYVCMNVCMY